MSLELKQLSKVVDQEHHLKGISLRLESDTLTVLLGPAQSGKTSLLRLIAGLDRATSGQILLDSKDVSDSPVTARDVAFVYQDFVNYPHLSVFENIASPLRARRADQATVRATVDRLAQLLGISDLLERRPGEISGGQQQRVAMGRALAKDAAVVLLDEPLANLDYKLREELRRELPRLFKGSGKTVIYASADPNDAFLLSDQTVILHQGRIAQQGDPSEMQRAPRRLAAAAMLADIPLNHWPMTINDGRCRLAGLEFDTPSHMRSLADGDYTVTLRAEDLGVDPRASSDHSLHGTVVVNESLGHELLVHAECDGQRAIALAPAQSPIEPGRGVHLYFDPSRLHAFDAAGMTVALGASGPLIKDPRS